jgi:hypothetical protein
MGHALRNQGGFECVRVCGQRLEGQVTLRGGVRRSRNDLGGDRGVTSDLFGPERGGGGVEDERRADRLPRHLDTETAQRGMRIRPLDWSQYSVGSVPGR